MTQDALKRKYLGGFCSLAVVNSILFDDKITTSNKVIALAAARKIAAENGRTRVYVSDWEEALKKVREG